ncbi:uncharacterized protein ARMOST_22052 [Armillaria ostoyae]|uniref:Uncharacterized protein n=1 Tax=Armillaria ostoyae TaxID=47428 RepID=A0A284SBS9_ARMOS|nr:uncharacterized protein ARMOST_22052 [Armillaria ostoyae]
MGNILVKIGPTAVEVPSRWDCAELVILLPSTVVLLAIDRPSWSLSDDFPLRIAEFFWDSPETLELKKCYLIIEAGRSPRRRDIWSLQDVNIDDGVMGRIITSMVLYVVVMGAPVCFKGSGSLFSQHWAALSCQIHRPTRAFEDLTSGSGFITLINKVTASICTIIATSYMIWCTVLRLIVSRIQFGNGTFQYPLYILKLVTTLWCTLLPHFHYPLYLAFILRDNLRVFYFDSITNVTKGIAPTLFVGHTGERFFARKFHVVSSFPDVFPRSH